MAPKTLWQNRLSLERSSLSRELSWSNWGSYTNSPSSWKADCARTRKVFERFRFWKLLISAAPRRENDLRDRKKGFHRWKNQALEISDAAYTRSRFECTRKSARSNRLCVRSNTPPRRPSKTCPKRRLAEKHFQLIAAACNDVLFEKLLQWFLLLCQTKNFPKITVA